MSNNVYKTSRSSATVVGAGLGGLMMAIRLARRGHAVTVYDRRVNVGQLSTKQRSFTVTLSKRGIQALTEIDLVDEALAKSVGLTGRTVHDRDGTTTYVPYGKTADEQLHAIRRHDMNALLYEATTRYPNITCLFEQRLVKAEKASGRLWFQDEVNPEQPPVAVDTKLVIGADGIFSTVRQQMHIGERADYHQDCLDWGYKDVLVPAGPNGQHAMEGNTLHLWPRGGCTFFAFPTIDGCYAGNFMAPFTLLEKLNTVDATSKLLETNFADLLEVAPALPHQLVATPVSHFITTYTAPWSHKDKFVLMGDSAHGVTPFWGEGMNAAFEDSGVLDRYLAEESDDPEAAFTRYESERKPDTDLLAELAKQNFVELRDGSGTLPVMARKRIESALYNLFPKWWLPLNIMISHRLMSYQAAVARYEKQRQWARYCGIDLVIWLLVAWLAVARLGKRITQLWRTPPADSSSYVRGRPGIETSS